MSWVFGETSKRKLATVHPALQRVVNLGLLYSPVDFAVTCGIRTIEEQKKLVASGDSKTLNSRHLTGAAVDVAAYVNSKLSWEWTYYQQIAIAILRSAKELNVPVIWGGSWETFKDGVHFELDRRTYK